jgi:hypothetical protein
MKNLVSNFGKFLIDNANELEKKFENDRQSGKFSTVPNIFKFMEIEYKKTIKE